MSDDKEAMPMHSDPTNGMAMHMTFFWGKDVAMLFTGWPNGNLGMYVLALAFVFSLAVIVELFSILPVVKLGSSPLVGGLIQAWFYGLRMALVYLIMLSVMSYNFGVFIFVVAGHVVGRFLLKYREISKVASKARTGVVSNV